MKLPLTQKEFDHIYGKVPRLCVDLVVKTKDGILLTRRQIKPWFGMWHFPGGTVRYRESLEKAVARVAADETNLKVKIKKLLGPYAFYKSDLGPLHVVSIGFLVEVVGGKLKGGWQAEEMAFFKDSPKQIIPEQKKFLLDHKLITK